MNNSDIRTNSQWRNFGYGYLAGMMGIVASHPIDTIKTNYQEGNKIIVRNLYRGIIPPLLGVGLEKAIVFGVFETTRNYTQSDVVSGGIAGLTASLVVTPFERIKILLQSGQTIGGIDGLKKLGVFQGLSATLTRETPGFAIYFYVYNSLKARNCGEEISPYRSFGYGAMAGTAAWTFIYPMDRVKTHIQIDKQRRIGFLEAAREIYREYGVRSFYRGFHLALSRAIPLHATAFTTVELCKKYL